MRGNRRYSLTRYSVNPGEKNVEVSVVFSEAMGAVAGTAVPVAFRDRYTENVQGATRGTISVLSTFLAFSDLQAAVRMSADIVTQAALSADLRAAVYAQKDIPAPLSIMDSVISIVRGSKNMPEAAELVDRLMACTMGSKNIPATLKVSEVLTSVLEATSQTTEQASFQLTIPPGGELRIDSEWFFVLLNGENALHNQSGDWINVSRSLLRLIIESASGGKLQGSLIYTERYL